MSGKKHKLTWLESRLKENPEQQQKHIAAKVRQGARVGTGDLASQLAAAAKFKATRDRGFSAEKREVKKAVQDIRRKAQAA